MTTAEEIDPFAAPTGADPFADPERATYPQTPGLVGRLVLIAPRKIEDVPKDGGGTKERMTADVIVLDGKPALTWKTKHNEDREVVLDAIPSPLIENMWLESVGLISACRPRLRTPNQPLALGRVELGPIPADKTHSRPYRLADPTPADRELAMGPARDYMRSRSPIA